MAKYFRMAMLLMCIFCAGCESMDGNIDFEKSQDIQSMEQANEDADAKPLRIAFASVISPIETRKSYQEMVQYIARRLGRPAVLIQRKTYEELNMLLGAGEADIAFVSTGAYTSYNGMMPLELLAMVQTDNTVFYQAYIIVRADSDIHDVEQLRGKNFAFTDPLSYSGRLAIDYMLLDDFGTTPEQFFHKCFYTFNHDKSIWAVLNKLADGAGIDSQIYYFAKANDPDIDSKIRIIRIMPPTPTGPVVMRRDLPQDVKDRLRDIFFHMDENPELAEAMHQVIIDKFVEPIPEAYDELKRRYQQKEGLPGV